MKEPLLRLIACHRGRNAGAIRTAMDVYPTHYEKIKKGPLRGCVRRAIGSNLRSVFKLARGHVLEFAIVIRPGWPPEPAA